MTHTSKETVTVTREFIIDLFNKVDDARCWLRGYEAGGGKYYYEIDDLEDAVRKVKKQVYSKKVENHE